jgi:cytochrome P450
MRDKTVPAGASLIISPWLIHRHRLLWKDPDLFDPDRYAAEGAKESQRNAYLPFGMGQRVCLGAAFAQQEAALILAKLLREYRIETVPGHVPRPIGRITIRSSNGVRLRFVRRSRVPGAPAEGADRHAEERAR